MSLRVDWAEQAIQDLRALRDWRLAAAMDVAVDRYASSGIGFIRHVHVQDGPDEWRLLVPGTRVYARVRYTETTLYVERVIFHP